MNALKHLLMAVVAATSLAHAADTPATSVAIEAPSSQERMTIARKAIDAKEWNRAITELNAVVRAEPRNADAHNLLGYSYRKRNPPDLAKAFDHYKTALRLDPKHKGAHEYIGEAYLMDKNPTEAEKHLAQLEAICGNRTCEEYADLAKAIADYKARNR